MEGLAPIDGWVLSAIIAKALGYGVALLAMGGPLFLLIFPTAPADVRRLATRIACAAAALGLAVLALRWGIRAGRISGMGLPGMADPMMLGFVWQSPFGAAAVLRGIGYALVFIHFLPRVGRWLGLAGAGLIAVSFTQVGHVHGLDRVAVDVVLVAHLLMAAFWVGALAPLHVASRPEAAALLERFGQVAAGAVGLLLVAGVALSWQLSGGVAALIGTAYGLILLGKVAAVTGLLALAARNKLRLVPEVTAGQSGARLQRAIRWEMAVVCVILLATATVTSVTVPPVNL